MRKREKVDIALRHPRKIGIPKGAAGEPQPVDKVLRMVRVTPVSSSRIADYSLHLTQIIRPKSRQDSPNNNEDTSYNQNHFI
jgi:hypothetical protein